MMRHRCIHIYIYIHNYVYSIYIYVYIYIYILVGGFNPSEKYYIVNWDDYSQYMET